ncbi:hypothetical protein PBY51_016971 [Eleginops maclovinus]|uniref:Uncharacterized protein n=1 Tax=Eleginops maclovinus TaxID=56733 RepID=A0AAN7WN68_ELEMC|nr:hypothetical protein PBY51_016971 [Eleginops maclovinus]
MGPSECIFSSQLLHAAHLNLFPNYLKDLPHKWLTFVIHHDELAIEITRLMGALMGILLGTGCMEVDHYGTVALADMWSATEAGDLSVHDFPWFSGDYLVHRQSSLYRRHNLRDRFIKSSDVLLGHPEELDI